MLKNKKSPSIIVAGGLNTDIVGVGCSRILEAGELTFGKELKITPGGKSRNLAQMMAMLKKEKEEVAMIGLTSEDPFGFWKVPMDALIQAGVNIDFIKVLDYKETGKLPGVALIPVDKNGQNQIYVLPGVNEDFSPEEIKESNELFVKASKQNGILALALEMRLDTAKESIRLAKKNNMKVILDPGGINDETGQEYKKYLDLIKEGVFLIKPNIHETKILTKVEVVDIDSAKLASHSFFKMGVEYVLITDGKNGAYLFSKDREVILHIPIPDLSNYKIDKSIKDETGCGDQTMATLCTLLSEGVDVVKASQKAILTGTIQFYRSGVIPLNRGCLDESD